jgi:cysteine desulfurase
MNRNHLVNFDQNATTPLDPRVLDAMLPFLRESWGNPSSFHAAGRAARSAVENARQQIARQLGCDSQELIFTSGGTESINLALCGTAKALNHKGRHIVTSSIEHHAVLHACRTLRDDGFETTIAPVLENGRIEVDKFTRSLRPDTVIVSIMHANNETGVIQPIQELAEITRRRGIVFHTDAVQTLGKIDFRISDLGVDLLSASAHKLCGPKGSGLLFRRKDTHLVPAMHGGMQEQGFRAGTENVAGIVGMAASFSLSAQDMQAQHIRLGKLRERLESGILQNLSHVQINGANAARLANTSNITFEGVDGESIVLALDLQGIHVSTGSACSTGEPEPSHVLLATGLSRRQAQCSVRFSMGQDADEDQVDRVVSTVVHSVKRLREFSC